MDWTSLILAGGVAGVAAGSDLRTGRIPNALTYLAIAAGLVWGLWPGAHPSVGARVVGLLVAFVPAFALFLVRSIGGGDVKLLAAVGAIVGYPLVLDVLFYALLAGGALALGILIWKGRVLETLAGFATLVASLPIRGAPKIVPAADLRVPFATAIFAGTAWTLLAPTLRLGERLATIPF